MVVVDAKSVTITWNDSIKLNEVAVPIHTRESNLSLLLSATTKLRVSRI